VSDESDNKLIQQMGRDVHTAVNEVIKEADMENAIEAMKATGYQSFIAGYQAAGGTWPEPEKLAKPPGLTIVEND
jgi:hypothetical protein